MRDLNPHARGQLILSQPCLPFHQFPVNNMVGAARFELARWSRYASVTITAFQRLCLPIPPSAYKIPNQSLEKYSGVLAPTSSMLFLARPMSYRTSHVLSIVELFTRSESGAPVGYRSCQVLPQAFIGWQCLSHNSIWTVKELAFADCVSVYSRPARLYIVITRLIAATVPWGLEPHDAMHHRVHACGVEPLTNHSAYNTSSMSSLSSLTTLTSR